jgi:hypothetical protein
MLGKILEMRHTEDVLERGLASADAVQRVPPRPRSGSNGRDHKGGAYRLNKPASPEEMRAAGFVP